MIAGREEVTATAYKLCYYVPESHLETTKRAVFDAGAGHIGDHDSCCWQVRGESQFRQLRGSLSFLGQRGEVAGGKTVEHLVEIHRAFFDTEFLTNQQHSIRANSLPTTVLAKWLRSNQYCPRVRQVLLGHMAVTIDAFIG